MPTIDWDLIVEEYCFQGRIGCEKKGPFTWDVSLDGTVIGLIRRSRSHDRTAMELEARLTGYPNITAYGCRARRLVSRLVIHHLDQIETNRACRERRMQAYAVAIATLQPEGAT